MTGSRSAPPIWIVWGTLWNLEANQEVASHAFALQVEQTLEKALSSSIGFAIPAKWKGAGARISGA